MTDQAKAIEALKCSWRACTEDSLTWKDIDAAIDRAVSISRASQGSKVESVSALVAAAENAVEVLRQVATKGRHIGPLYSHANAASWNLSAAIAALSPPAEQGSRVKLESDLADLVRHCWVHSAYRNCGYEQMDTAQKQLYDAIISTDPDEAALSPPATTQASADVPDLATVEFEVARAIVRVAGVQVRAFTLANRNEKALALAMEINRAFVSSAHLLATPQAPEDVRARAVAVIDSVRSEDDGFPSSEYVMEALDRAHLLATPVTVTMEECDHIGFGMKQNMGLSLADAVATTLRRVLGDRIQIAGEPS